ncbi:MAG: F0F1 ATP synthase subunit A [Thermoanaerobaculia bacterium]
MSAENPLSHVIQHPLKEVPADLGVLTPKGMITVLSDQIVMMIVAALILTLLVPRLVRRRAGTDAVGRLVPTGFANFFETVCEYLRKEIAQPVLGAHTDRFIRYVWSAFFFVLTINLLGLLPIAPVSALFGKHLGGTATGNIWVTGTLAVMTLLMMIVNGLRHGGMAYIKHFCPGPLWLAPLLIPVEIIGLGAKAFALAVRLFANMIAGHILLGVLLGLIFSAVKALGTGAGLGVAAVVVLGSVAISLLEVFVAFLQAFIFAFLTALFIGMSVNVHHDDHGHDEAHGSADAADPAGAH